MDNLSIQADESVENKRRLLISKNDASGEYPLQYSFAVFHGAKCQQWWCQIRMSGKFVAGEGICRFLDNKDTHLGSQGKGVSLQKRTFRMQGAACFLSGVVLWLFLLKRFRMSWMIMLYSE